MIKAHQHYWGLSSFSSNCYLCFNPFLVNTHTTLFRGSSIYARYSDFKWLMQEVTGYLEEMLVLLHSVANHWLSSKKLELKSIDLHWHRTLLYLTDHVASLKNSSDQCTRFYPVWKKNIATFQVHRSSEINMLHSFKALILRSFCRLWNLRQALC